MSSRITSISILLNKTQNHPDFKLENLEVAPNIFKSKLFKKILDPAKEDPKEARTVIVKCLYKSCL